MGRRKLIREEDSLQKYLEETGVTTKQFNKFPDAAQDTIVLLAMRLARAENKITALSRSLDKRSDQANRAVDMVNEHTEWLVRLDGEITAIKTAMGELVARRIDHGADK